MVRQRIITRNGCGENPPAFPVLVQVNLEDQVLTFSSGITNLLQATTRVRRKSLNQTTTACSFSDVDLAQRVAEFRHGSRRKIYRKRCGHAEDTGRGVDVKRRAQPN